MLSSCCRKCCRFQLAATYRLSTVVSLSLSGTRALAPPDSMSKSLQPTATALRDLLAHRWRDWNDHQRERRVCCPPTMLTCRPPAATAAGWSAAPPPDPRLSGNPLPFEQSAGEVAGCSAAWRSGGPVAARWPALGHIRCVEAKSALRIAPAVLRPSPISALHCVAPPLVIPLCLAAVLGLLLQRRRRRPAAAITHAAPASRPMLAPLVKDTLRYGAFVGSFSGLFVFWDEAIALLGGRKRTAAWRAMASG